jgi:hypothetical protein
MGALGILGGLAAAGAAYNEGQRNKERKSRQDKYDAALADLRSAQAENLRGKSKGPEFVVVKDAAVDPAMSDLPSRGNYSAAPEAGPQLLNSVDPDDSMEERMAQGGMVGYANGGMMGYANGGMIAEHPCTPSNSNWQRQSFKK